MFNEEKRIRLINRIEKEIKDAKNKHKKLEEKFFRKGKKMSQEQKEKIIKKSDYLDDKEFGLNSTLEMLRSGAELTDFDKMRLKKYPKLDEIYINDNN